MKFLDKIKDLFSDEEEIIETKEIEIEETKEEHKLPTFMRNKIEEEQKREEERKQREITVIEEQHKIIMDRTELNRSIDRDFVRTRSNNNFSFPMDMEETEITPVQRPVYSNQNVLQKEKKPTELYSKKDAPKPKKFKPTPVISPVYGVLDKNYTKDEVKVSDEKTYELQRASRKVDFETVRNKAFGSLTDDIRNNLCENCELYQEVKITKAAELKTREKKREELLADIKEDISLGDAEDNYFDFGVDYEIPKREDAQVNIKRTIEEEIKIVNHNDEESTAEKIEVKEMPETKIMPNKKELDDTKEFEKINMVEETVDSILEGLTDINEESSPENDIFNLIDSMYDEEEK